MINFILGRTNTGKTEYVVNSIKATIDDKVVNELILIVPEQFTLEAERDIIKKLNSPGILKLQVISFKRLFHMIKETYAIIEYVDIDDLGKAMALRSIFDKHSDEFHIYQKTSKKPGFIAEFISRMNEFKRNGVDMETIESSLEKLEQHPYLANKLADILLGMKYFDQYYGQDYKDEEDKYEMILSLIPQMSFLKDSMIWIDGFSSFSHQEYKIIGELQKVAQEMYITLNIDEASDIRDDVLFKHTRNTLKKLRILAEENEIEENEIDLNSNVVYEKTALNTLNRELFSYPYFKYDGGFDSINIYACDNQQEEIELLAKEITRLVADEGYQLKELAVLTADLGQYGPIVARVFTSYNIPYFVDLKVSAMKNPFLVFIMSIMDILSDGYKNEAIMRYLKTGLAGVSIDGVEQLEDYTIEKGIKGKRWFDCIEGEENTSLESIRDQVMSPLKNLNTVIKGRITVRERIEALFNFLIEKKIPEKINDYVTYFEGENLYEYSYQYAQLWNQMIAIFDQYVELEGDKVKSFEDFKLELEAGFSELKLSIIPTTDNQVFIGDFHRSKNNGAKGIFVIGMNDGLIPSGNEAKDLLLNEEKEILKDLGLDITSDNDSMSHDESFRFYSAIAKAREFLTFTYSKSDLEGKALRPSIYFEKMKQIYPEYTEKADLNYNVKNKSLVSNLAVLIRELTDGTAMDQSWYHILNYMNENGWQDSLEEIEAGLNYSNQKHGISGQDAKNLYQTPLKTSVSRLEKYANCPFAHFVKFGLKPKDRKTYEVKMPDVGNLFHTTIDMYSQEIRNLKMDWDKVDEKTMYDIVDRIVESTVEDYGHNVFMSTHRYKYLINKIKRIGRRSVKTLTEQLSFGQFTPTAFELSFSEAGGLYSVPPIVIQLDSGDRVYIEGRIDRVDMLKTEFGQFVKVIDYKSGNMKLNLSDIYMGFQMQLMVYLNAIIDNSQYFREDLLHPGGVFYFKIDDPLINKDAITEDKIKGEIFKKLKMDGLVISDIRVASAMDNKIEDSGKSDIIPFEVKKNGDLSSRSQAIDSDEFNLLMDHVKSNIKQFSQEILDGNIEIKPVKQGMKVACGYCEYSGICQFDLKFEGNSYKNVKEMKKEDVLEQLKIDKGVEEDA